MGGMGTSLWSSKRRTSICTRSCRILVLLDLSEGVGDFMPATYRYAVPFVYGQPRQPMNPSGPEVSMGIYMANIFINNPGVIAATVKMKVALAPFGGQPGHVTDFSEIHLQSDQSVAIGYAEVLKML